MWFLAERAFLFLPSRSGGLGSRGFGTLDCPVELECPKVWVEIFGFRRDFDVGRLAHVTLPIRLFCERPFHLGPSFPARFFSGGPGRTKIFSFFFLNTSGSFRLFYWNWNAWRACSPGKITRVALGLPLI